MSTVKLDENGLTTPSINLNGNTLSVDENGNLSLNENKIGGGHNVGEQWISMDGTIPFGGLAFLGQTVSIETYIELYNWVETHNRFKTEAEWQSLYTSNNGNVSFYAKVDDNTFRMPSFKGYLKANTTAGGYTKEGLPNITGTLTYISADASNIQSTDYPCTGAFRWANPNYNSRAVFETNSNSSRDVSFNASLSNSIYGNSSHVTPETNTILIGVYAFNTIVNSTELDLENIRTDIENINSKFNQGIFPFAPASIGSIGTRNGYLQLIRAQHDINSTPMDGVIFSMNAASNWHSQLLLSNGGEGGLYYRNNNNGVQGNWERVVILKSAWNNGANWYRKYSDGWIEQGGQFSFTSQEGQVTLHLPFSNEHYYASASLTTGGSSANINPALNAKSTTSFQYHSMLAKACSGYWYACGY